MKLITVFKHLINEADEDASDTTGDNDSVVEFTDSNFAISIFRNKKSLLFSPQQHNIIPNEMIELVKALREEFRVINIFEEESRVFEMVFDPRENFDKVIDFIKKASEKDQNLV